MADLLPPPVPSSPEVVVKRVVQYDDRPSVLADKGRNNVPAVPQQPPPLPQSVPSGTTDVPVVARRVCHYDDEPVEQQQASISSASTAPPRPPKLSRPSITPAAPQPNRSTTSAPQPPRPQLSSEQRANVPETSKFSNDEPRLDLAQSHRIQFSRFAGNKRVVEVHRELKSELKSDVWDDLKICS